MPECTHCKTEVDGKDLRDQSLIKTYRLCPHCGNSFTVDKVTRHLQIIGIVLALFSLALTLLLYFKGTDWLIPAVTSYVLLGILIYIGNKRVAFVPYNMGK